ncbi:MAG TPA: MMPL family transporter [Actinomycetota bacterium]|nr:MMPL family transporter [Actinomycetota bacterium]
MRTANEGIMARLGGVAYRHRRLVVVAWIGVLVAGTAIGGSVFGKLTTDTGGRSNSESERAYRLMRQLPAHNGPSVDMAAFVPASPDDPAVRAATARAVADLKAIPGIAGVLTPADSPDLAAADGSGFLVAVDLSSNLDGDAWDAAQANAAARLERITPGTVAGSDDLTGQEMDDTAQSDLERAELIALPLILIILLVAFRSFRAAILPIVVALVSISGSLLVLLGFASVTKVSIFAVNVVTMLGLGLAVDYSLLAISRFREERARGLAVEEAVRRTTTRAGRTIVFSGLTVTVSLAGLLLLQGGLRSVAYGGIGVVLVAMAAAVTLVPALLSIWGRKIRPAAASTVPDGQGVFFRLARVMQRRAAIAVPVLVVGLAVLAVPFLQIRSQDTDARYLPRGSENRQFFEAMYAHFPALTDDPIEVVAVRKPGVSRSAYAAYVRRLGAMPDVVRADVGAIGAHVVEIDVVSRSVPESEATFALVGQIRSIHEPFPTLVTGRAAETVDAKSELSSRVPLVLGFVALATFVLLFLFTGSVVVPIKALVMNVLSLGASFGTLVWVFQDGHLSGVLGFDPTGSVWFVLPVLVFAFAFGLSMDYEVFLLGRIKESYDRTGDNDLAVATGLQRTGGVVSLAALLMVAVFAGFAAGEMLAVKQLGVGLALAVALDATVIRMLLVPSTMKLMGRWNWWAPPFLRRLHARIGLHEAPEPAAGQRVLEPVV